MFSLCYKVAEKLSADPHFTATWLAIDGASTNKSSPNAPSLLLFLGGTYCASPELRDVPGMLFPVALPPDNYKVTRYIAELYADEMRFLRIFGMPGELSSSSYYCLLARSQIAELFAIYMAASIGEY